MSHHLFIIMQFFEIFFCKHRIELIKNVVERRIDDFVIVWQTVEFRVVQIQVHVMFAIERVQVRVRPFSAPLKVLRTNQTAVHVVV